MGSRTGHARISGRPIIQRLGRGRARRRQRL